jgi:hypothetical protein
MLEAPRRPVDSMPTDVVITENGKASETTARAAPDDELRTIAPKVYFDRPATDAEIDRELRRLR